MNDFLADERNRYAQEADEWEKNCIRLRRIEEAARAIFDDEPAWDKNTPIELQVTQEHVRRLIVLRTILEEEGDR